MGNDTVRARLRRHVYASLASKMRLLEWGLVLFRVGPSMSMLTFPFPSGLRDQMSVLVMDGGFDWGDHVDFEVLRPGVGDCLPCRFQYKIQE